MGHCGPVPVPQFPTKSSMYLSVLAGFDGFDAVSDISDVIADVDDVDVDVYVDVDTHAPTRQELIIIPGSRPCGPVSKNNN